MIELTVRKPRLGVVGVFAGLLLLVSGMSMPSWAETPTSPPVEDKPWFSDALLGEGPETPGVTTSEPLPEGVTQGKTSGDSAGSEGEETAPLSEDVTGDPLTANVAPLLVAEGDDEAPADDGDQPLTFPTLVAEFALSPMSAKPGDQVRFSGKCLMDTTPGDSALGRVYWANEAEDMDLQKAFSLKVTEIDDDGTFDQLLTIPLDAAPGLYDVGKPNCYLQDQAWAGSEELGAFTVLATDTPGGGGGAGGVNPEVPVLAETGGNDPAPLLVAVGGCLFTAGSVMLFRRRQATV